MSGSWQVYTVVFLPSSSKFVKKERVFTGGKGLKRRFGEGLNLLTLDLFDEDLLH